MSHLLEVSSRQIWGFLFLVDSPIEQIFIEHLHVPTSARCKKILVTKTRHDLDLHRTQRLIAEIGTKQLHVMQNTYKITKVIQAKKEKYVEL